MSHHSVHGITPAAPRATAAVHTAPAAAHTAAAPTAKTDGNAKAHADDFHGSQALADDHGDKGGKNPVNIGALTGNDAAANTKDADQADEKRKAEEKKKQEEAERAALEEKKKQLEAEIEAKQKELEQAKQSGDEEKVKALSGELDGLQKQLEGVNNQLAGMQQPANNGPAAAGAGNQMPEGAAPAGGGGDGGGGGAPMGGGGAPMGGGGAPMGGGGSSGQLVTPPSPTGPPVKGTVNPNGTGQDAVNLARKYLGHNSIDIKGALPNFTAAGGQTNDCADFVSSVLESTGRLNGHHINVEELEGSLLNQGYARVSKDQAQPGDVWINGSKGHTELVAEAGGNVLIGSNNDRPGHQVISETRNPEGGYYYHLNKP